jgi:hypothetical protein
MCDVVDWINLADNTDQWRVTGNTTLNILVLPPPPKKKEEMDNHLSGYELKEAVPCYRCFHTGVSECDCRGLSKFSSTLAR